MWRLLLAAFLVSAHGASWKSLRQRAARGESLPSPDEKGLFGPSFEVSLLEADSDKVAANLKLRLAVSEQEQHHGLMFRQSLDEDEAMLFLYREPAKRVLWMQNTYVPLEAAWFTGDGVLQEVQHLIPLDLTYRWSGREDIVMGLEVPEGFFESHGLRTDGALRLDFHALRRALRVRGYEPIDYLGPED
mmetsp:Transcript_56859/g.122980  ORF Transcript_56859/g.122980 Transcript_56859/m.122980 type:complete len:189 (-) Transcript_56859:132-698(-)